MPESRTITFLKQLVPPIISTLMKKGSKYGWKGDFKNWQAARDLTHTYDDKLILENVRRSLLKVKNGEAVYERDSVLFDHIQYSWPLLSALMWIAAVNKGSLSVADFGGSLGSTYFQNRLFLNTVSPLEWSIIEQKNFVDCGKKYFQNDILQFFDSLAETISQRGLPDLLILSCVLPYLEKPYDLLNQLMQYQIPYIIIDNTYFNYENRDRICIQTVPPAIYDASYPCWMLNYEKIKTSLSETYSIISEHQNESFIFLDGKKIQYKGLLLKIKK